LSTACGNAIEEALAAPALSGRGAAVKIGKFHGLHRTYSIRDKDSCFPRGSRSSIRAGPLPCLGAPESVSRMANGASPYHFLKVPAN
jgi:hypothetical protein